MPTALKTEALYQVMVEFPSGEVLAIGPKWQVEDAASGLAFAINKAVIAGKAKLWGNAHVVPVMAD